MRIALLDDDPGQSHLIREALAAAGHFCRAFGARDELLTELRRNDYEMLIVDWRVTDASGTDVLRWVRTNLSLELPVLFLATRSGEDDIIAALAAGADDYLIKPVRRAELLTRVQAQLRRAYPAQSRSEQIQFGQYVFEMPGNRLTVAGNPVEVTQKEFDLALLFFRNLGRPLSRAYILESIWAQEGNLPSRTMDTHVSRVRSKLGLKPENGFRLAPVYSFGYQLEQLPNPIDKG